MLRLLVLMWTLNAGHVHAEDALPYRIPSADEALTAFAKFSADPTARLDATGPFLDFIRSSGEVHIVLNDALLAWMYGDLDAHTKAVLYAAFLGGNMEGQLRRGSTADDNVAGMRSALRAYAALKAQQPDFELALLQRLTDAEAAGGLASAVDRIVKGDTE
jgi:hypothetical protein